MADELVIGPDGEVTVEGGTLRATLAGHAGRYHLRSVSAGLLILARPDHDGRQAGRVLMSGEVVGPSTMLEIVDAIAHYGWRGELVVVSGSDTRGLVFDGGALRGARTDVKRERLGEVMIVHDVLTEEQRRVCLRDHGSKRRFGETAIDKGYLDREKLFEMLRAQSERIFRNAMLVRDGHYAFVLTGDETEAPSMTVHLPVQWLVLETMHRIDELSALREAVPSPDVFPTTVPGATRMSMAHALIPVAGLCDGTHDVHDIARKLGMDELAATKAIAQLVQLGAVELRESKAVAREKVDPIVRQLNEVLGEITDTVERNGGGKAMRSTLRAWVRGTPLADLFGESVSIEGHVSVDSVLGQLERSGRPVDDLVHAAHELISFAMFAATPALSRPAERALSKWVNQRMANLRA